MVGSAPRRLRPVLGVGFLALTAIGAQGAESARILAEVRIEGGDEDDRRFASAAFGLKPGQSVDDGAFKQALAAVRLVDRYQAVDGVLDPDGSAVLKLVPLPPLANWQWEGDAVPKPLRKTLLPELRKGQRLGPQRRAVLAEIAEERLREAGYAEARVSIIPEQEGRHLRLELSLGAPRLIREIRLEGDPAPYTRETLLKVAGLRPGATFWTPTVVRDAQSRLRQRLVGNHRLEGSIRLEPTGEPGVLLMEVRPGPKVTLRGQGLNLLAPLWGQPRLTEFVPLARAERYSPSILEEGAGRITTYFRNQGYPEVKVKYERVVTEGTAEHPTAVTISYFVDYGPRRTLGVVQFEGNRELPEEELRQAVSLPKRFLVLPPLAKAETVKALEERVTAYYLQRGFPDVQVRRRVDTTPEGVVEVRLLIREGQRRYVNALVLDLPLETGLSKEALARCLLLALSDRPVPVVGTSRYRSDRRHLQGFEGSMEFTPKGIRLNFKPALPLVRNDLAMVVSDLRQRLSSAGIANPEVKLSFEDDGAQPVVRIQVPAQPLDQVRRLVIQGSDRTRARAVLREAEIPPGAPLDPKRLDEGQVQLGSLGVFQRVDLLTVKELPGQAAEPWQRGDLALRLQERSPWVFSEGFGYDNTQGYHFDLNAQQLDVGGMGRVLDYGIRAGDQTLNSPALRRAFPTGNIGRSVDSYSIGYTDPWFVPGSLDSWLASRTRFHLETAYIEEEQAAFFAHHRRFVPSLEWRIGPTQTVQLGYRFERVEVALNTSSDPSEQFPPNDLELIARTPARSIISAPYLQVTVDRRDRPYDPTQGTYFLGRLELANQFFGTSANSSFVKLDLRHQWNWSMGFQAESGVVTASLRLGLARPTAHSAEDLPLSERFFGGGPFTVRGVEPDFLGALGAVTSIDGSTTQIIPLGGQGLAVINLEYRFPLFGWQSVWGEVFVDSGQIYRSLSAVRDPVTNAPPYPPFRTTPGVGLIFKLGFPLKVEYAADWKRITGQPRTSDEQYTQLKSLLISAGFQF
jgi:outer membrane protein assembly factor BamA